MDSEDWKDFKKKGKDIRRGRQARHRRSILRFACKKGLGHRYIQDWQIRISNEDTKMDIFPQSKRYHNITLNKRGTYHHLIPFLNSIFKDDTNGGCR